MAFIGLNPSTADAELDDNTIRRCIQFSKDWGFGGLLMLNLFAWRCTKPEELKTVPDPIGPLNDFSDLIAQAQRWKCKKVVAAWGNHGRKRGNEAVALIPRLDCLARNQNGTPQHPLYVRASAIPAPYNY